ncbi:N-acetyltransferase [Labrys miyagiensis]|uniref:N-acetyltransferase n=1 Tax=Labrys miyagiensis TaxID=346912 RepID=A0ABQ6CBN8_9HYPH|nr:GNAT family N-acetyltransferase [Labrys miyagiensis]GLS17224.1 N-acetyltransferase [Labrys miyagiensis]
MSALAISVPTAEEAHSLVPALADILIDCVEGGSSVSFLLPISRETAEGFYAKTAARVAEGSAILFVATLDGEIVGTVQLCPVLIENQPHRADVAKLLVHRRGRQRGIAQALMVALEERARAEGRTLLSLDTTAGSPAERLYEKLGWQRLGVMPGHALMANGEPSDTTFFWKALPT